MPLRVVYRRAIRDGLAVVNPCEGIELPANRSERVRIVSAEHAGELVEALPTERDRGLWATAFFAGLRRGELMALRWQDVDLASGELHVERSYDPKERGTSIRSPARSTGAFRLRPSFADALRELAIASRRSDPAALVFGRAPTHRFTTAR